MGEQLKVAQQVTFVQIEVAAEVEWNVRVEVASLCVNTPELKVYG